MNWVTIYGVRNGWGIWITGVLAIVSGIFTLWLILLFRELIEIAPSSPERRKRVVNAVMAFAMFGSTTALFSWLGILEFRYRADMKSGQFMEPQGAIEDVHIDNRGRSHSMLFRIGEHRFTLPGYGYPQDCSPLDGELVTVDFEMSSSLMPSGPPAYKVLMMRLAYPCKTHGLQ
jgi:hypothetical protein